ncbi:MAG TPA: hypothetical protein VE344_09700 [Methylomirabilota bacterium]|nr:hypothetical protein [Methylomirabilota bacterium]
MNAFDVICLGTLEAIALYVIAGLWLRRRTRIIPRIFWSIILLIPLFGLVMFFFIGSDLDKNPDKIETQSDRDAFYGGPD